MIISFVIFISNRFTCYSVFFSLWKKLYFSNYLFHLNFLGHHLSSAKALLPTSLLGVYPPNSPFKFIYELIKMRHTRFEKARIIGARALQINMGAPPLIRGTKNIINVIELAEMEYLKGIIPINPLRTY